jgi:hypothetical protein
MVRRQCFPQYGEYAFVERLRFQVPTLSDQQVPPLFLDGSNGRIIGTAGRLDDFTGLEEVLLGRGVFLAQPLCVGERYQGMRDREANRAVLPPQGGDPRL